MILQMSEQYVDTDVQYIAICILSMNVLLNPLLHSTIRRPVRRGILLVLRWLLYLVLCCKSTLLPTTKIGAFSVPKAVATVYSCSVC